MKTQTTDELAEAVKELIREAFICKTESDSPSNAKLNGGSTMKT